ncbi:MAG: peptidylprolyl isomerase [Actinomycetota bacterium]
MTPLRRLAVLLPALALVLLAGACSGGDEELAGVGDTIIRLSEVESLYEGAQPIDDGFRDTLFAKIALEALTQALASEFRTTVDPAAVEDYYTRFQASMAESGVSPAELLGVENASLELVHFNAEVVALRDAALEQLAVAPATVDRLFEDPITLTRVCAKHILVETLEEAEAVQARLAAGEDFATVAGEVSLDTQSAGGDLGCGLAGDYVDEFARAAAGAPLGEVTGPVESDFGFHLIVVSERTIPSRIEYLGDPWGVISSAQATMIWGDWITGVLEAADIWVAEEYGTWTVDGIQAPGAETTTTTTTTGG